MLFVTLQDPELKGLIDAAPQGEATEPGATALDTVARAVVTDDLRRDRRVVLERLKRLGVQCIEASYDRLGTDVLNRYLAIKQCEII